MNQIRLRFWRWVSALSFVMLGSAAWRVGGGAAHLINLRSMSALRARRMMPTAEPEKSPEQILEEITRAENFVNFLGACPEPFHVVHTVSTQLKASGFEELSERDLWASSGKINPGGKYFFKKNLSSIVAFAVGGAVEFGNHGFKVIGAHTDSPALKVKPRSKRAAAAGVTQLSVETYGGGLWHTWFDRDLSLAGRVIVAAADGDASTDGGDGERVERFEQRLVHVKQPVLKVPTLCIHLQSQEEREAFKVNKEDHLVPLLCGAAQGALHGSGANSATGAAAAAGGAWAAHQEPALVALLAAELGCTPGQVADFELTLFDTQAASLGGLKREFVNGGRLDNLASCFCAVEALLGHAASEDFKTDRDVSMIALFDHEEVASPLSLPLPLPR